MLVGLVEGEGTDTGFGVWSGWRYEVGQRYEIEKDDVQLGYIGLV